MKSSHTVTPRTLGDCAFIPSADPVTAYRRRPRRRRSFGWGIALLILALALCVWLGR